MKTSQAGAAGGGTASPPPPPWGLAARGLDRLLRASFFVLGMGLLAPSTAILQTMDFLNSFYGEFHPSRTLPTGYNLSSLVALVLLFCVGERLVPNKRRRLLSGYLVYFLILLALPLLDWVIVEHCQVWHRHISSYKAVRMAFTIWSLGSVAAGVADAFISSVAFGQAAALGPHYTHAFVAGKATSGLIMAALRCISKGSLSQDMQGLRQSTSIYVCIAALIALTCVLIVGVLLPRLQLHIEQLRSHPGMSAQQTLDTLEFEKCSYCRLKEGGSTAAGADASSCALLQLPRCLSTWGSNAPLLPTTSGSLQQQGSLRVMDSLRQSLHGALGGTASRIGLSRCSMPGQSIGGGGSARHGLGRHSLQGGTAPPAWEPPASELERSTSNTSVQSVHAEVLVTELPASAAPKAAAGEQQSAAMLQHYAAAAAGIVQELQQHDGLHHRCTCGTTGSGGDAASTGASRDAKGGSSSASSSTCSSHSRSHSRAASDASADGEASWRSTWLLVWPFCLALLPAPLVTSAILPMTLSKQAGEWPALRGWYVQVLLLTTQLGTFAGTLLPVRAPRHPRATLLAGGCGMVLFVPAFVLALLLHGGPPVFLGLTLLMYSASGYLCCLVFCLASRGLLAGAAERVQMLLVLTSGLSFVLGGGVSWLWVLLRR